MIKPYLTFLLIVLFFGNCEAQVTSTVASRSSFMEWNFGGAFLVDEPSPINQDQTTEVDLMPGTSFLWGRTYVNENNFIIEYEAGFAIPTVVTGKVGIGKKINNTRVVGGIRAYPLNLYLQSSFTNKEKGYWIVSLEFNPIKSDLLGFGSRGNINFGYRWNKN